MPNNKQKNLVVILYKHNADIAVKKNWKKTILGLRLLVICLRLLRKLLAWRMKLRPAFKKILA